MLKRYLKSYRSNIILFIINIPVIVLIVLLYPFLRIRIGEIQSRIIPAFILQPEIYLCEIKEKKIVKKKNEIHLFYFENLISNKYVAKHWKKKFIILPRQILEPIYYFFANYQIFRNFLSPFRLFHELDGKIEIYKHGKDVHNLLPKYDVSMKFNQKEKEYGEKTLVDFGYIEGQKIVCFANRDKSFRKETINSPRNAMINTYESAIKFLAQKNIFNIRMGRKNLDRVNFSEKKIIDYCFSQKKSDFLDMFLMSKCDFLISTDHGINDIATFFRKNRLIVNFQAFNKVHFLDENYTPFILPKKYLDLMKNKLVNYRHVFEKKLYLLTPEKLEETGYKLIDNTEKEILDATKEMYDLTYNDIRTNIALQEKYWDIHKSYFKWRPKSIMMSNTFFNENIKLFL